MKTQEILTINALALLGLSVLTYISKSLTKTQSTKDILSLACSFLIILAIVLLAISQLISETKEPMDIGDEVTTPWNYTHDVCWQQQVGLTSAGGHPAAGRPCGTDYSSDCVVRYATPGGPPHCMCGPNSILCNTTQSPSNSQKFDKGEISLPPDSQERTTCYKECNQTIDPPMCFDINAVTCTTMTGDPSTYKSQCAAINNEFDNFDNFTLWCGTTDVENP